MPDEAPAMPVAILLISPTHERAHYAFVIASAAAALGRQVCVFATNGGVHALCNDWSGLEGAGRDAVLRRQGLAGLGELRDAAQSFGARLMACESGMISAGIAPGALLAGVSLGGIASFLTAADGAQTYTL